jgi:ferrous iron transport protein B
VPTVAKRGEGLEDLIRTTTGVINGTISTEPHHIQGDEGFQRAVAELVPYVEAAIPNLPNPRWVAMRLLDGDQRVREAIQTGELEKLSSEIQNGKI